MYLLSGLVPIADRRASANNFAYVPEAVIGGQVGEVRDLCQLLGVGTPANWPSRGRRRDPRLIEIFSVLGSNVEVLVHLWTMPLDRSANMSAPDLRPLAIDASTVLKPDARR